MKIAKNVTDMALTFFLMLLYWGVLSFPISAIAAGEAVKSGSKKILSFIKNSYGSFEE